MTVQDSEKTPARLRRRLAQWWDLNRRGREDVFVSVHHGLSYSGTASMTRHPVYVPTALFLPRRVRRAIRECNRTELSHLGAADPVWRAMWPWGVEALPPLSRRQVRRAIRAADPVRGRINILAHLASEHTTAAWIDLPGHAGTLHFDVDDDGTVTTTYDDQTKTSETRCAA